MAGFISVHVTELCVRPFHDLLISKSYPSLCQIVRRHLQPYFVSWQNADVVHPHLSRNMRQHFVAIFQLHFKHRIGQSLEYCSVLFYALLLRHLNL